MLTLHVFLIFKEIIKNRDNLNNVDCFVPRNDDKERMTIYMRT